ncbi:transcriptional regulator [Amycolatopsis sp. WAC 01375]|uniref:SRPBCC family protein n=1 Tax=unclassified Amycolatopsis TaxID=2618356 RepID=UPI000F7AC835|nr:MULTISPECIES: SRPBCC family protein [unclassified Amycolatopsis]RSM83019.1 transcriptional regulator [Amycolatopsis sp. WAC 01375]RSN36345.1 transcriptional regulator [Amycolatopsis sp. WAC 01416]
MTDTITAATQVYRVYIKATPEKIWDAITKPEWSRKYGYTGLVDFDLRPGGKHATHPTPEYVEAGFTNDLVDGEVLEVDPPRKLVITWKLLMDPSFEKEPYTKLTYEIEETKTAGTRLTVTHDVTDAPTTAALVNGSQEDVNAGPGENAGGGWAWILSDLKTLLETDEPLVPAAS